LENALRGSAFFSVDNYMSVYVLGSVMMGKEWEEEGM
jgi:hypothetical protein